MVPSRPPAATDQWQKTSGPVYLNCCTDVLLLYKNDVKNLIYYVRGVIYYVILVPGVNEEICDFSRGFYKF